MITLVNDVFLQNDKFALIALENIKQVVNVDVIGKNVTFCAKKLI